MPFANFWTRWKEPITAGSIVFTIAIGIYGGYEQREQTILAEKQWRLALENRQSTKPIQPSSGINAKPSGAPLMVSDVSIFPFILSSLSPLLLFGILVAVYLEYKRTGKLHHSRLNELESLTLKQRLEVIDIRFAGLSSDSGDWKEAVRQRFANVEDRADGVDRGLVLHQGRLNKLEMWVGSEEPHGGLWRDLAGIRGELHGHYLAFMLDLTSLMAETTALAEGLLGIQKAHPDSPPAQMPFSQDWSESADGIGGPWAFAVNAFIRHATAFSRDYKAPIIDAGFKGRLWTSRESFNQCLSWIQSQYGTLVVFRRNTFDKGFGASD